MTQWKGNKNGRGSRTTFVGTFLFFFSCSFFFFFFLFPRLLKSIKQSRRHSTFRKSRVHRDPWRTVIVFSALKRLLFLSASRVPNRVTVRFQRGKRGSRLRAATVHACWCEIFLLLGYREVVQRLMGHEKAGCITATGNPCVIICPCITCVCAICLGLCVHRVYRE